jgi:lysozyme
MYQMSAIADRWDRIRAMLVQDEGRMTRLYLDTACPRKITGGVGHNFTANPVPGIPAQVGFALTDDQIDRLFEHDLQLAISAVYHRIPFAVDLAPARFDVLAMMAFNLGIGGLLEFRKMRAALETGDYAEAARQMLASDWARQLGDGEGGRDDRPERLANIMRTGEYPAA